MRVRHERDARASGGENHAKGFARQRGVEDFPDVAIPIIERLIQEDKWIEEESLDLIDLV